MYALIMAAWRRWHQPGIARKRIGMAALMAKAISKRNGGNGGSQRRLA